MPRRTIDITVPDLTGKRAVVTGASDGMGLGIAERLAAAGAEVIMPVRNRRKGEAAIAPDPARASRPPKVSLRNLDLSSLESVAALGDTLPRRGTADPHPDQQRRRHDPARPAGHRGRLRAAVRHQPLGHFALVAHLLPLLQGGSRPGDLADQHRRAPGRHQLGRPELGTPLPRAARLQPIQDRVRAVRPRTRPPQPGRRLGHHKQPRPSRRRTHEPARGPSRARPRRGHHRVRGSSARCPPAASCSAPSRPRSCPR